MSIKGFLSRLIIGIITIGGIASYADSTTSTVTTPATASVYTYPSSVWYYMKYGYCPNGSLKIGSPCKRTGPEKNRGCPADHACIETTYSCPSGYSLSGSTCLKIGCTTSPTTTPATANVQYAYSWYFLKYKTCPLGGYVQIAPCTKKSCDYSKPVCAKTTYSCPSGYSLQPDKQCKLN